MWSIRRSYIAICQYYRDYIDMGRMLAVAKNTDSCAQAAHQASVSSMKHTRSGCDVHYLLLHCLRSPRIEKLPYCILQPIYYTGGGGSWDIFEIMIYPVNEKSLRNWNISDPANERWKHQHYWLNKKRTRAPTNPKSTTSVHNLNEPWGLKQTRKFDCQTWWAFAVFLTSHLIHTHTHAHTFLLLPFDRRRVPAREVC